MLVYATRYFSIAWLKSAPCFTTPSPKDANFPARLVIAVAISCDFVKAPVSVLLNPEKGTERLSVLAEARSIFRPTSSTETPTASSDFRHLSSFCLCSAIFALYFCALWDDVPYCATALLKAL
ncbi:hypothetical protein [Faecalibacterium prausnitzii]|uniref:hypothetical protein n=1 Tax=Faecalibacterium prausnitzii TaxID=853 RepID=UPI0022E6C2BB|nr:hypothetical protein [Faecalibacterium prausnitzii]